MHCCSSDRDGQGLAAPAAALTAVTPPCSPYNLALLFLPAPSFVPRAAVGESCEGFNAPGLCEQLAAGTSASSLVINPASPNVKNLEEFVCTLHFKNEVASDHTSLFCLAKLWLAGVVWFALPGDGSLGILLEL